MSLLDEQLLQRLLVLVALVVMTEHPCEQILYRIVVFIHLGLVKLDEVLHDVTSWNEVVAAGDVPLADEDADVSVVVDTGIMYGGAPTAKCAAEPSVVECVVVALGAYGVPAPILCNKLPLLSAGIHQGPVCCKLSVRTCRMRRLLRQRTPPRMVPLHTLP